MHVFFFWKISELVKTLLKYLRVGKENLWKKYSPIELLCKSKYNTYKYIYVTVNILLFILWRTVHLTFLDWIYRRPPFKREKKRPYCIKVKGQWNEIKSLLEPHKFNNSFQYNAKKTCFLEKKRIKKIVFQPFTKNGFLKKKCRKRNAFV